MKTVETLQKHANDHHRPPPRSSHHPGPSTITLRPIVCSSVSSHSCRKLRNGYPWTTDGWGVLSKRHPDGWGTDGWLTGELPKGKHSEPIRPYPIRPVNTEHGFSLKTMEDQGGPKLPHLPTTRTVQEYMVYDLTYDSSESCRFGGNTENQTW